MLPVRVSLVLAPFVLFACSLSLDVDDLDEGCAEGERASNGKCVASTTEDHDDGSPCEPGEYVKKMSETGQRVCAPCEEGEFSDRVNAVECRAWRPACVSPEREAEAPSKARDRVCTPCSESQYLDPKSLGCRDLVDCGPGDHVSVHPTATTPRECSDCEDGTYSSSTNAASCQAWSPCEAGTVEVEEATSTTDYECEPCTTSSSACTPSCAPGTFVDTSDPESAPKCTPCPPHTFASTESARSCKPWTACSGGATESVAPASDRDRVCSACGQGRFGTAGHCAKLTSCGAGEYQTVPPSGETDRSCAPCADGTFSQGFNVLSCSPWQDCGDGFIVSGEPGASVDRQCTACEHALVSWGKNATKCEVDLTVHAGYYGSCVLRKSNGAVTCWSSHTASPSAEGIAFKSIDVALMTGNNLGGCGVRSNGRPYCWAQPALHPPAAAPPDVALASVAVGDSFACGLTPEGTAVCWGLTVDAGTPRAPLGPFSSLDSSPAGTCARSTEGSIQCWGPHVDWSGEGYKPSPTVPVENVKLGMFHACGLTKEGKVECWGSTAGDGVMINPPEDTFASLSVGYTHTCGVTTNDEVKCWGIELTGNVIRGTAQGKFASVSAGMLHSCGVRLDTGLVQCWGAQGREPPLELRHPELAVPAESLLQHVDSTWCVHPKGGEFFPGEGTRVILYPRCTDDSRWKFSRYSDMGFRHLSSGRCLQPEGGDEMPLPNTPLVLGGDCAGTFDALSRNKKTAFEFTPAGSLRHINSGLCVHPRTDFAGEGDTELVLREECDESWLRFAPHIAEPSTPEP